MSVYGGEYTSTYEEAPVFPYAPLDVAVELDLAGVWTDVTAYAMQREGTSPPITIQRGRPSETSQATPSSAAFQLNNRDGRFSPRNPTGPYYGELAVRNNPVRISVPDATTYLRFADDDQSYISCPDSGALQLTSNFDVRIDMWLDDYQPTTLCGKWGNGGDDWAWCLILNGDGTLTFYWYNGDETQTAQSTQPLPYLGRIMVRVLFAPDIAEGVYFYTAPAMSGPQTQLGAAIPVGGEDYAQAAAGQVTQVGCVSGFVFSLGDFGSAPGGCLGKVFEFSLYNASGTLVADPQFSSQTAGASSFADAQGNTWTLEGTSSLSARSFRAHLECSSLPQQWDETGTDVWTPVGASGVLRRLQQGNSPIQSVMRWGIPALAATYGPLSAYWPCEDFAGSTSLASGLAGGSPMQFAGAPAFQGQAGSLSADSVFACSAELVQPASSTWTGAVPRSASSTWGTQFLLAIPSGGLSTDAVLVIVNYSSGVTLTVTYGPGSNGLLSLTLTGYGALDCTTGVNGTGLTVEILSTTTGQGLVTLAVGETEAQTFLQSAAMSGNVTSVIINPTGADLGSTEIGQVFVSPNPPGPIADLLNAYAGETAADRFVRICSENNITSRIYGFPDLTCIMGAQEIDTLGNVLQSVEDADRGQIYEPAETLGLGYRTLHSMCAQSPAITLDYALAQFGGDGSQGLVPTDDDQYTVNDVTLTRNNGSSYQYQVTEGPMSIQEPPDGAGDYSTSLTTYNAYDTQLPYIAAWMASIGTCDEERYPSIPLNLARPQLADLVYAIQDVRIGDYLAIVHPPAWLPPGDIDQLAYGVTEKLGGYYWNIAWNAVPEDPYAVAVAGTYAGDSAHADTAGSQLASSAAEGSLPGLWDFAGGTADGWTGSTEYDYSSVAVEAYPALPGTNALVVTATGGGAFWQGVSPSQACAEGDVVAAQATVYFPQAVGAAEVTVSWFSSDGGYLSSSEGTPQAAAAGQTVVLSLAGATAPADAVTFQTTVSDSEEGTEGWQMMVLRCLSAVQSTLSVETTAGPIWTTSDADFPFDIGIAGEQVSVSAITGGSSPQTFTITRAVNGVVKAQAEGAPVAMFYTPVAALS